MTVEQAEALLMSLQAQIKLTKAERDQVEHAIKLLVDSAKKQV